MKRSRTRALELERKVEAGRKRRAPARRDAGRSGRGAAVLDVAVAAHAGAVAS